MSSDASALPGPSAAGVAPLRPIAVVWCRQVDNEAQSPGYTTIPQEFEGLRETMEAVRAVGHITINLADTHDYWDPDPGTTLSFYPNLFLYPAYGGRYTCVGRMFLSKEDRPRLGMKTFVLETASLLHPGDFGAAVIQWHALMGETHGEIASTGGTRDPELYGPVGEGLLFHRSSREPVLLIASERWASAMSVLLHLVRALPSSLVSMGAILAFPYFVPPNGLDLDELQKRIPISLLLMREPRHDAESPRHPRRVQSWRAEKVTVHDLAASSFPPASRGKESLPTILRYLREGNDRQLAALRSRVDVVELPRRLGPRPDGTTWTAANRRKEIGRIAEAMEGTAVLLEHPRSRIPPANREALRRSQEYLHAVPATRTPARPTAVVTGSRHLPTPSSEAPRPSPTPLEAAPVRSPARDSVPVPKKQLVPLARGPHAPAVPERPMIPPSGSPERHDPPQLADAQLADRFRDLEDRITSRLTDGLRTSTAEARDGAAVASAAIATAIQQQEETLSALRDQLESKLDAADALPKTRLEELDRDIRSALDAERTARAALEARLSTVLHAQESGPRTPSTPVIPSDAQAIHRKIEETEARLHNVAEARAQEQSRLHLESIANLQKRLQERIEERLTEALDEERQRYVALVARLRGEMDALLRSAGAKPRSAEPKAAPARSAEFVKLEATVRAELADLRKRTDEFTTKLIPIVRQAWAKIEELERKQRAAAGGGKPSPLRVPTPPPRGTPVRQQRESAKPLVRRPLARGDRR
ncbi:MAG: hypothetical protein L3J93_03710 [Thermoplasmata archaeon]|nr:hypothetical protein [Thermoplasmata archaeon]